MTNTLNHTSIALMIPGRRLAPFHGQAPVARTRRSCRPHGGRRDTCGQTRATTQVCSEAPEVLGLCQQVPWLKTSHQFTCILWRTKSFTCSCRQLICTECRNRLSSLAGSTESTAIDECLRLFLKTAASRPKIRLADTLR